MHRSCAPPSPMLLDKERVSDWKFFAEGGAHILFRYTGDCQALRGKVLRVAKRPKPSSRPVDRLRGFSKYIVERELMPLDEAFIRSLLSMSVRLREPRRLSAGFNGLLTAELCPDLCFPQQGGLCNYWSIEIKPKWHGLLAILPASQPAAHWSFCRFCQHNYEESSMMKDSPRYCPSDVFSNDSALIKRAIEGLCHHPKNNFKAFLGASPVPPQSLPPRVLERICKILLEDPLLSLLDNTMKVLLNKALTTTGNIRRLGGILKVIAVLRDCSVILGFSAARLMDENLRVSYDIHLIDTDGKPDEKLPHYFEEFQGLRNLYNRNCAWSIPSSRVRLDCKEEKSYQ